jgi:hypothetical protein
MVLVLASSVHSTPRTSRRGLATDHSRLSARRQNREGPHRCLAQWLHLGPRAHRGQDQLRGRSTLCAPECVQEPRPKDWPAGHRRGTQGRHRRRSEPPFRQLVDDGGPDLTQIPCARPRGTEGTPRCNYNRVAEALDQRPSTAVRPLCNVRREDDTVLRWVCAAPLASNSITDCAAVRHIPIKYPEGTNGRHHDKKRR